MRNFGKREKIALPTAAKEHGGDRVLRDLIFKKTPGVAPYLQLPGSRAGAMSCLTGIAARKSCDEAKPIKISDLVKLT
jgi:hypothetical protein